MSTENDAVATIDAYIGGGCIHCKSQVHALFRTDEDSRARTMVANQDNPHYLPSVAEIEAQGGILMCAEPMADGTVSRAVVHTGIAPWRASDTQIEPNAVMGYPGTYRLWIVCANGHARVDPEAQVYTAERAVAELRHRRFLAES